MKRRAKDRPQGAYLAVRINKLTRELEELVPAVKAALKQEDDPSRSLLVSAARSLERAATAIRALAEQAGPDKLLGGLREILEGTSPLMSMLGSRVVLARADRDAPKTPSAAAQALAVLLEDPARAFGAGEIAERLGCSVPIARTTLHRLVRSGHATRPAAGRFQAPGR